MDFAPQLSIVTGALLSDTHRDDPAQQTEVHRSSATQHRPFGMGFLLLLLTGTFQTVAQN